MVAEEKLKQLLDESGRGSKAKLAKHLNVSPVYVTRWVADDKYGIPKDKIVEIEEFYNLPAGYFLGNGIKEKPVSLIPVVGTASCGGGDINHLQVDGMTCYFASESYHKELYCVIADGESMSPEIDNGDQIVCDPILTPEHGDLVHYKINGESAIKVLVENKEAGIISLKPINSTDTFKTRVFRVDDDEIAELKMAKVVGINKINFNNKSARLRLVGE